MNLYKCDYCHYQTNREYNLRRHLKLHNAPISTRDYQQISTPHGTQALNLSNQINLPSNPTQVINIHGSGHINREFIKKPINFDDDDKGDYFDLRLKEYFKLFICGPSRSGKTTFVKQLLENIQVFAESPPEIVILVYQVYQEIYNSMNIDYIVKDDVDIKEKIFRISNGRSAFVIFDDMINSENLSNLSNLFVVDGRHRKLSMAFLSQKIFVNNDYFRQISQNSDYFLCFKNPRSSGEIRSLAHQMTPGNLNLLNYYNKATVQPYTYLFINLTQECDERVRYLSHIFEKPHIVKCYNSKSVAELTDGKKDGNFTNFKKMWFNKPIISSPPRPPSFPQPPPPPPPHPPKSNEAGAEAIVNSGTQTPSLFNNATQTFDVQKRDKSVGVETRDNFMQTFEPPQKIDKSVGVETRDNFMQTYEAQKSEKGVGVETRDNIMQTYEPQKSEKGVGFETRDNIMQTYEPQKSKKGVGVETRDNITQTLNKGVEVGTQDNFMQTLNKGVEVGTQDNLMQTFEPLNKSVGTKSTSTNNITENKSIGTEEEESYIDYDARGVKRGLEEDQTEFPLVKRQSIGASSYPLIIYENYGEQQSIVPRSINVPSITYTSYEHGQKRRNEEDNFPIAKRQSMSYEQGKKRGNDGKYPIAKRQFTVPINQMVKSEHLDDSKNDVFPLVKYNDYIVECEKCKVNFPTQHDYNMHKKSCKMNVYACGVCGKNYSTKQEFLRHKFWNHGGKKKN